MTKFRFISTSGIRYFNNTCICQDQPEKKHIVWSEIYMHFFPFWDNFASFLTIIRASHGHDVNRAHDMVFREQQSHRSWSKVGKQKQHILLDSVWLQEETNELWPCVHRTSSKYFLFIFPSLETIPFFLFNTRRKKQLVKNKKMLVLAEIRNYILHFLNVKMSHKILYSSTVCLFHPRSHHSKYSPVHVSHLLLSFLSKWISPWLLAKPFICATHTDLFSFFFLLMLFFPSTFYVFMSPFKSC